MRTRGMWNRRQLLQATGSIGALSGLATLTRTAVAWNADPSPARCAYVGSLEGGGRIQVFAVDNERWRPVQTIASARPANLVLHPGRHILYVANEIDTWRGLPCGSVEAYAIDAKSGTLTKLSEEPLALSATMPRGLAVSPDGRHLVVAVYGGGAYNLLPILEGGSLGRVTSILKQTGSGPHGEHQRSAHPHTVLFSRTGGSLFGTDSGSDRLNRLQINAGSLEHVSQTALPAGSGPGQFVIHPAGHLLFLLNDLQGSITSYSCNALNGTIGRPRSVGSFQTADPLNPSLSMAIHPSGEFLYTAQATRHREIDTWRIDSESGGLTRLHPALTGMGHFRIVAISRDGSSLYAFEEKGEDLLHLPIYPLSGRLGTAQRVAALPLVRCVVMNHLEV